MALETQPPNRARLTVVVLCLGGLTAALTQTMVIPIQGDLPRLLHAAPADAGWVITITLLTGAVSMPIAGRLGDLYGKAQIAIACIVMLLCGSVICALSDSLAPMLAGRALQGLAGGFLPVAMALIREVTPPHLANTAMAAMSATIGVGAALGLPLSAWLTGVADWHAMFWMAAGLAAVLALALVVLVPRVPAVAGGRLDLVGAVGLTVGLVCVLVAVSKGNSWSWTSARTLGFLVAGVAALVVWAAFELRHDQPLVDLRVSAHRPVLLANIAAVAIGFGMMSQSIVIPQLLLLPTSTGYGLGQTLLQTSLWMAPGGLVMMALAPASSWMITRLGAKLTLMIGATVLGCGYLLAFVLHDMAWHLLLASCVASAGVGIGYAAMPTLIMGSVPPTQTGSAVGVNALMRSVGTTSAAAALSAVLAGSISNGVPAQGAYLACFLIGAAAAFVGVAIAALVPQSHHRTRTRTTVDAKELVATKA